MERIDRGDGFIQVIKTLKEILGFEFDYEEISKHYPYPKTSNEKTSSNSKKKEI